LTPLGFWRKGRSRIWLADRGFWLSIVEFQPSSFGKGSYLNVSAHWLWGPFSDVLSFDYSVERKKPLIAFHDSEQFKILAEHLAEQAAKESQHLQNKITSIHASASLLVAAESASEKAGRKGGWLAFHAAIASGLSGDMATARILLDKADKTIGAWRPDLQNLITPYEKAFANDTAFQSFVAQIVDQRRSKYNLGPWPYKT